MKFPSVVIDSISRKTAIVEADDPLLPRVKPRLEVREDAGRLFIDIAEPILDFSHSATLREALASHVAGREQVTIDVSAVVYVDHFGFDALLSAVRSCPGLVRYRGARRPIQSLFELGELGGLLSTE